MGSVAESIGGALDDAWNTVTDEVTRWGEDISAEWQRMDPALQMAAIGLATWGAGSYLSSAGYFAEGATAASEAGAAASTGVEVGAATLPEAGAITELTAAESLAGVEVAGSEQAMMLAEQTAEFSGVSATEAASMTSSEVLAAEAGSSLPWGSVASTAAKVGIPMLFGSSMGGAAGAGGSGTKLSNIASSQAAAVSGSGSGSFITEEQKKYAAPIVGAIEQQKSKYNLLGAKR